MQLFCNIIISSYIVLLLSSSVMIGFSVTKFFNISQAAIISFAAYCTYFLSTKLSFPLFFAIFISIILSIVIGLLSEIMIFRSIRCKHNALGNSNNSFRMLIASIGLYTIFHNIISLFFGEEPKIIQMGDIKVGYEFLGAYITPIQLIIIAVSTVSFITMVAILHKTSQGKQIRAVTNNPMLCDIYGINSNRVILWATALSSILAAIAGTLISLDVFITPSFGFNYFLYGVVAMIIGGVGSYRGLIFGAILLVSAQHLSAYFFGSKWMDAVAYFVLIIFLIWKPLGFSGQKLKKVEV